VQLGLRLELAWSLEKKLQLKLCRAEFYRAWHVVWTSCALTQIIILAASHQA
jgi:hypothetical protein